MFLLEFDKFRNQLEDLSFSVELGEWMMASSNFDFLLGGSEEIREVFLLYLLL